MDETATVYNANCVTQCVYDIGGWQYKFVFNFKVMTGIAKDERMRGRRTPQWIHDFKLADFGDQGLFYEYLEMSECDE